jgi:hypothetical protein
MVALKFTVAGPGSTVIWKVYAPGRGPEASIWTVNLRTVPGSTEVRIPWPSTKSQVQPVGRPLTVRTPSKGEVPELLTRNGKRALYWPVC